jgi:carbonic anhydrase
VLCGHSSCGGAAAALGDARVGGVLDTWLTPLKAVRNAHQQELDEIRDEKARAIRIAELNVEAGVKVLMANFTIQEHIRDRDLQVHGTMFDLASGRVRDLGFGTGKPKAGSAGGVDAGPEEIVRGKHAVLVFRGEGANMQVR